MTEEEFIKILGSKNIFISEVMLKKLQIYASELYLYNQHTNLTAITKTKEIYLKHFYDSAILLAYHPINKAATVLDIGSGAGFPGLVLAILRPDLEMTLVDATKKKTVFLELIIEKLELNNVKVINSRVEQLHLLTNQKYDYITSRAVANIKVLLEISCQLIKKGGDVICLKGIMSKEMENLSTSLKKLSYQIKNQHIYSLPFENSQRSIIVFEKQSDTPLKYPREYQQIIKNPL